MIEVDFSFGNKVYFSHMLIRQVEYHKSIPREQHRSRLHFNSIKITLLSKTFFDIVRLLRIKAALGSFDDQSYYNCIIHANASLVMQAMRAPLGIYHNADMHLDDVVLPADGGQGFGCQLWGLGRRSVPGPLPRKWGCTSGMGTYQHDAITPPE